MSSAYTRAVGIVIHQNAILLMQRQKDGRTYFVFPGGHVDPGESVEEAAVREVLEETNVTVSLEKPIYTHFYKDGRVFCYFLCRYLHGEVGAGSGTEFLQMTEANRYQPMWVSLDAFATTLVYPLEIRDWILKDVANNFASTPREEHVVFEDLRQNL